MARATKEDICIGENLKRIRQDRGKSQQQTGEGVGVTQNQIRKYEIGQDRIPSGRLALISEFLDTHITEFYRGTSKVSAIDADAVNSARKSRGAKS